MGQVLIVCLYFVKIQLTASVPVVMDFGFQEISKEKIIKLDVGGFRYKTSLSTLTSIPNTMLHRMFTGSFPLNPDKEGWHFIDRNGQVFGHILDFLRCHQHPPQSLSMAVKAMIQKEADFFLMEDLANWAKEELSKNENTLCFTQILTFLNSQNRIFTHADLSGQNLSHMDFTGAALNCCNLQGVNLQDANLEGANLQNANLQWANLQNANLQRANLQGANLQGANLRYAKLGFADLQNANLERAKLSFTSLENAIL